MLQFKPPPASYLVARSDDDLGKQLEHLSRRAGTSPDPPIAEIERVLQKYLSIGALPASKPSPTAQDKRAVELGLLAFYVIAGCQYHLKKNAKLDNCLLNAWPAIWRWLQFLNDQCCQTLQDMPLGAIRSL
ncbi:hypothetical protein FIBSPDRAFT_981435 [Athelia psychrophila]|uniref:Uncharacterized protein n=1 Tax=Athelia psychrophila TaxID=1759441 RepID=A0A166CSZ9_9AGAM|nr:hypothetical protein FIBSPDRAFT_981435 [Fibularhizoctonia sp. CBS 109695]